MRQFPVCFSRKSPTFATPSHGKNTRLMLTIQLTPLPILQTPRLSLRAIEHRDTDALFRLRSDPETMRYIGKPLMAERAEAAAWIEMSLDAQAKNETATWVICLKNSPDFIGYAGFWRMTLEHHRTEIGYMLLPEFWGKGYASEAIGAVVECGFQHFDFHSVEAHTDPLNTASERALEKNGFVREARFRQNFFFEGTFLDTHVFSKVNPNH